MIRSPEGTNLRLGEWIIPKRALIMIPSFVVHRNQALWSAGPDGSRAVEMFWAERFLKYPGSSQQSTTRKPQAADRGKAYLLDSPTFSTEGLSGCFMPYGGGQGLCPGRHFAKQEIIFTLATMVTLFDIEILERGTRRVEPDLASFGFGALKPKGKVSARIRWRKA